LKKENQSKRTPSRVRVQRHKTLGGCESRPRVLCLRRFYPPRQVIMHLEWHRFTLKLHHPFNVSYARTASGAAHEREVIFVRLEHEGTSGWGEASPSKRFGESPETVEKFLSTFAASALPVPFYKNRFMHELAHHATGNSAAKCAVDLAWHDWWGRRHGFPMATYLSWNELPAAGTNRSSFTIGIDDLDTIAAKVREAEQYPVLKVKLGTDQDRAIIETVRTITDRPIRVDANEGWGTKEHALGLIEWLASRNVELIEQPLPAADTSSMPWLKERSPLPLIADESFADAGDSSRCAEGFHGVNVKLLKTGGLTGAVRAIDTAREQGLKVMIGCFIESSLAVTAAAHLAPYADWADLDGAALCANDPWRGVTIVNGEIAMPGGLGLGCVNI
jgi:L-alanine-DL-glutamate epimerase-like enolase superfamily enzyme